MKTLSEKERRALLKNPNVKKITEKHVVYTSKFKIHALEAYLNGKSPNQIFLDAGIDPDVFVTRYCQSCLKRWKKKCQEEGLESLREDKRGSGSTGRPKDESLNELTYEELLAVVEIQKEVILDLKKRNALAKKKRLKS